MKQLDDDRQELLAEKAKFETMARLNRPIDSGISRTEIETAIKIAQVKYRTLKIFEHFRHISFFTILRMLLVNQMLKESGSGKCNDSLK